MEPRPAASESSTACQLDLVSDVLNQALRLGTSNIFKALQLGWTEDTCSSSTYRVETMGLGGVIRRVWQRICLKAGVLVVGDGGTLKKEQPSGKKLRSRGTSLSVV